MKDEHISVGVDIFFILLFLVLGIKFWSSVAEAFINFIPISNPTWGGVGVVLVLNTSHFLFGLFQTDDDFANMHAGGMTASGSDYLRIVAKILSVITIGPSVYLRQAIVDYRKGG